MPRTGQYLYAVIDAAAPPAGLTGIDGAAVRAVAVGSVAAVVSDVPLGRLRPERKKLAAHFDVLKTLMRERTILPMAFGLVADDDAQVRGILAHNRETFAAQLERFGGKVEMGLRLAWDVPNIFDFFVRTQPDLRAMRDEVFAAGKPTQDRLMDLGREFETARDEVRTVHRLRLTQALAPHAAEIKELKIKTDKDVVTVAVLVEADRRADFEAAVAAAAGGFGDEVVFELTGPFPPHNFVELRLSFDPPDDEE